MTLPSPDWLTRATIPQENTGLAHYISAIITIAIVTAFVGVVFPYASLADITMLYLIAIAIASLFGRGPALLASSVAVAAFDFCFVPPRFTFAVSDESHLLTFAVMFGAGLAISSLTVRLRRQQRDAVIRERDTASLLAFTRDIAGAISPEDVATVTVRHLEDAFPIAASVLIPDREDPSSLIAVAGLMPLASEEQATAKWAFDHGQAAGLGTEMHPASHVLAVPLVAADATVGVIAIQARPDARRGGGAALPLFEAFARQAGLALARVRYAEQARVSALHAHTEELRSSLLSTVSHDLRTPLAVITGAATTLRDDSGRLTPAARDELLSSIVDDAQRLERILGNLLQLTRLESGIVPTREWIPLEELVGGALTRLEEAIGNRAIELDVPAELMVPVDPVLFEQVLINLLENALKHGAPPIELRARHVGSRIELEVRDHGPGIPAAAGVSTLFDKFVRASTAPGAGLGLAVVRALVEAHGGTVSADNAPDGGARFTLSLPAEHAGIERPIRDTLAALPVRKATA